MSAIVGASLRLAEQRTRLEGERQRADDLSAKLKESSEESERRRVALEQVEGRLSASEEEASGLRGKLAESLGEQIRLGARITVAESELAKVRGERETLLSEKDAEIARLKAQVEAASGAHSGSSYVGHVRRFLKTKTFIQLVSKKAAPSFQMGYKECGASVGEGTAYEEARHGWDAFLVRKMEEMRSRGASGQSGASMSEAAEAAPSAPVEDEIPMGDLLSEEEGAPGREESEDSGSERE